MFRVVTYPDVPGLFNTAQDVSNDTVHHYKWTIGNGSGYHGFAQGAFGKITPATWLGHVGATIGQLTAHSTNGTIELRSSASTRWRACETVIIDIQGYGAINLNWNGTTHYAALDLAAAAYIVGQDGKELDITITGV
ncbi:hypothetical protein [Vibrio sp. SCSIO 43136]|uniref:hypothetical protein n=1 Tax=Vibrio sp. SCSIO 43136 TaxID=2819101 RepID=UPI002075EB83|nr:hypothetical protein [Vibrio sp. SCSIO 43136]USD64212.1 hypothetical protein J4N39_08820 [Vibrio sp. SCSIO 43136]